MLPFQWLKGNQEAHSFIYLLIQQIFPDCLVSENRNKKLNGDLAEVNQTEVLSPEHTPRY